MFSEGQICYWRLNFLGDILQPIKEDVQNLQSNLQGLRNSIDTLTRSVTELKAELAKLLPLDGSKSMTGDLQMNGNTVRNIRVDEDDKFSSATIAIIPQVNPVPFSFEALGALYCFDIANCVSDLQIETQKVSPFLRCNDPNISVAFIFGVDIVPLIKEGSLTTTLSEFCRLTPFYDVNGLGNSYSKLSLDLVPIIPDSGYRPYEALAFTLPPDGLISNPKAYLSFSVAFTLAEDRKEEHTGVAKGFRLEILNAQSLDLLAKIEDQKILGETTDGEFKKTYFKSPKRERSSFNDTYISTLYLTSGEIGYCESNQRFLSPCFVKAVLDKGFDIYPQDEILIHAMNLNIFGIFIHPLKGIANVESFIKNFHRVAINYFVPYPF